MARKKGRLPGRFVSAHLRGRPHRPGEYVKVDDYQEHVEPAPAKPEYLKPQYEFDFSALVPTNEN